MPRQPAYDRDALIARARDLFWSKGWAGTSMKDLERALDLRPGSFYAAFGSKDALYGLALELYADAGADALGRLAAELSPLEALKAHLRSFAVAESPARACMLSKTLLEGAGAEGALATQADALLDAAEGRFAELFRAAQAAGEVAGHHDPVRLARRYQADVIGLRASAERASVDATALAEDMVAGLDALR